MSDASTKLAHLKFEAAGIMAEARDMIDELRNCPPGHERANQLSQQIGSHLDRLSSAIDNAQVPADEPQPVAGQPAAVTQGYMGEPGRFTDVAPTAPADATPVTNEPVTNDDGTCSTCGRKLDRSDAEHDRLGSVYGTGYGSGGVVEQPADGEARQDVPIAAAAPPADNPAVSSDNPRVFGSTTTGDPDRNRHAPDDGTEY